MAKTTIPVNVKIPDKLEISLVRSDYYDISNVFRIAFEISLAIFSAILGYLLTNWPTWSLAEIILLIIMGAVIAFTLVFMIKFNKRSRQHEVESDKEIAEFPFKNFNLAINIPLNQKSETDSMLSSIVDGAKYQWRTNSIKTAHTTLSIKNINGDILSTILRQLQQNGIKYEDEKIILS